MIPEFYPLFWIYRLGYLASRGEIAWSLLYSPHKVKSGYGGFFNGLPNIFPLYKRWSKQKHSDGLHKAGVSFKISDNQVKSRISTLPATAADAGVTPLKTCDTKLF
jgi:hypothetical protein